MSSATKGAAWVLNLDVEYELEQGNSYIRGPKRVAQLRAAAGRIQGLLGPNDIVLSLEAAKHAQPELASGRVGRAWCPTPRALERLRLAGAKLPAAPSLEVLRRVNDRAFAVALDPGPLNSQHVVELSQLRHVLREGGSSKPWLLKRALSFAGRGHRRVFGPLDEADERWCTNAFAKGAGIVVEPLVQREDDYALHGWVQRDGEVRLGSPTLQQCDAQGNWQGSEPESELGARRLQDAERASLVASAQGAGAALSKAGYFGPFGVDAFRYLRGGVRGFNPMVEINARYSMGWAFSGCAAGD